MLLMAEEIFDYSHNIYKNMGWEIQEVRCVGSPPYLDWMLGCPEIGSENALSPCLFSSHHPHYRNIHLNPISIGSSRRRGAECSGATNPG